MRVNIIKATNTRLEYKMDMELILAKVLCLDNFISLSIREF